MFETLWLRASQNQWDLWAVWATPLPPAAEIAHGMQHQSSTEQHQSSTEQHQSSTARSSALGQCNVCRNSGRPPSRHGVCPGAT